MAGKYFEEFDIGQKFVTPGKTVTDAAVTAIVGLAGYTEKFFNDEEYAKANTPFGGRIAPGRMTLLLMGALSEQTGIWEDTVIALVGLEEIKVIAPLRIGDTIKVEMEITEKRETSKPDRGIIIHKEICRNQRGEAVAEAKAIHLVKKRP